MASDHRPKLFISYSHDSPGHSLRVLDIAQRFRRDGIECDLDQFVVGSPPEGWPKWMKRMLVEADSVLVVCTETYSHRFDSPDVSGGLGAKWESFLLTQELYESGGINSKYVPVIFAEEDRKYVPLPLRAVSQYLLPNQYFELHCFIKHQPRVLPAAVGEGLLILPPTLQQLDPEQTSLRARRGGGLVTVRSPKAVIAPDASIEALDVRLTDTSLHGRDRSDLLLNKAMLLQKLGRSGDALRTFAKYEQEAASSHEPLASDYLICKGKLIAQHGDYSQLRDYLASLDLDSRFQTAEGEHQLSPLLWRVGLLSRLPDSRSSELYLKRHSSTVTISDYQYAHNQQCIAFADILGSVQSPKKLAYTTKATIEQTLHTAYLGYASVEGFLYQDKCLASNLAMLGVLYLQMREPRRAYEHLLHARFAFQSLRVRPGHEAIAEITGLLKGAIPEAYRLLFGRLATIISHHPQGDLIRELYGDVSRYWSQATPYGLPSLVSQIYSFLVR